MATKKISTSGHARRARHASHASHDLLTLEALSRATLARQLLLERAKLTPAAALERLLAVQAQWPKSPFYALLARLADFERSTLVRAVKKNSIVRGTAFRGTIFLQLAKDMARFRAALQPALDRVAAGVVAKKLAANDFDRVVERGRALFAERARTFDDLRKALERESSHKDAVRAMAYLVRMRVPLVQVATDAVWGWPAAADFALAEDVVDTPFAKAADLDALVLRYLGALGPATVADAQTFTGVTGLASVFERLRAKLVTFRDDRGKELFDLPEAPRPPAETPAPVRFLPDFDNVAIGHADRRRFVPEEHRGRVFLPGLVVARTVLVDGRVAGTWSVGEKKKTATLEVEPFVALAKKTKLAIEEEAARLLDFAAPDVERRELRFVEA
jgi:hypothetical protein